MVYPILFSDHHRITLVNCQILESKVVAKSAWIAPNLESKVYELKKNAITSVCQIKLPIWAISDEKQIFLESIELEILQ